MVYACSVKEIQSPYYGPCYDPRDSFGALKLIVAVRNSV